MTWLKFALQKIIINIWLTVFQKMLDSILISITLDKEQLKFAKKKKKKNNGLHPVLNHRNSGVGNLMKPDMDKVTILLNQ